MNHYQFFCANLPSIVVTAATYKEAELIAEDIYFATIEHFDLVIWNTRIEGYYVGRTALSTRSARLSQPAKAA